MHTILLIPCSIKFFAARNRPGLSRNSLQRALPIIVPPYRSNEKVIYIYSTQIVFTSSRIPETDAHVA